MQVRQRLIGDDSAVSPVIGVILMVAITVILAAVIASFVLGMGPNTSVTPQASFSSEKVASDELQITMNNGNAIEMDSVIVQDDASNEYYWHQLVNSTDPSPEIKAGTSVTLGDNASNSNATSYSVSSGYEIALVYEDGDTTSTLQTFEN